MSRRSRGAGLLAGLASDLAALFPARGGMSALLAVAVLLQVAYWYFGAPGPGTPRDPLQALSSVLWATLLLGLLPLLLARPLGLDSARLGLSAGDRAAGREALLIGVLIAVPVGYLAASDPSIRTTYPWPGEAAGGSLVAFLSWIAIYSLYYLSYEFFYRGFLLRGLEPTLGRDGALWLQTVASTMLHLGGPLVETVAALPAGLLFGIVALRTRSLLYVVLIHLTLGVATDLFSLIRSGAAT